MGQGLACYECIWWNTCQGNTGLSASVLCCSCWMCASHEMEYMRGEGCLKVGFNQGIGYSFFCFGEMCCAPQWLVNHSIWQSIGNHRGQIYDVYVQNAPIAPQPYGGQQYGGQAQPYGGHPHGGRPY